MFKFSKQYCLCFFRCFESQEIADNGSTTKDITCKARKKVNLQDIKPLEQLTENKGKNADSFVFLQQ